MEVSVQMQVSEKDEEFLKKIASEPQLLDICMEWNFINPPYEGMLLTIFDTIFEIKSFQMDGNKCNAKCEIVSDRSCQNE